MKTDQSSEVSPQGKSLPRKVVDGIKVAPAILLTPLYGIALSMIGHTVTWSFSKWIYGATKPTECILHEHFDSMQKLFQSGKGEALEKLRAYKTHPALGGISLITTFSLAFLHPSQIDSIVPARRLLLANATVCIASVLASMPLYGTMLGNRHAKKWIAVQGKLTITYACLATLPGLVGKFFIHQNWAILFTAGVLERFYVLCILSQLGITDRVTYLKYYSPMFMVATLLGMPLGLVTFSLTI